MIMMIRVECLTGKLLMQTTGGVLVDVNHDSISLAEVVLSPKVAVGDAAFDNWFVLAHFFYHLDYYCLPATNPIFSAKMPDDDMIPPR